MSISPISRCAFVLAECSALLAHGFAAAQTTNSQGSANAAAVYRVAGTVVSKTDAHPLDRARVTLRDAKDSQKFESIVTAEDGRFAFENVTAGKYSLSGAKRGFITASYDQHDAFSTAIVTGAGLDTEALALKLASNAVIWGKVLDEAGEPVRHASVTLYYDNHQEGVDQIQERSAAQTDDLGTYELPGLMPGTYFLSARATPWYAVHPPSTFGTREKATVDRSLDVAYPVTYYPDVTDCDSAAAISLKGGERAQIDIHLNPVPALRLLFRVPGDTHRGFAFPRLEQPAFEGATFIQPSSASQVSPGMFEITGIPAGHYNLWLQGQGTTVRMNGIDLSKDGEQIDSATAEPAGNLKISVQIPGESSIPKGFSVGLRSKGRSMNGYRMLDAKGEAEIDQVPAGRYDVLVWGARKPYSIARMTAEGADVSGHSVVLGPGASASASLTLVAGSVKVEGVVKKAGQGFAGAMVVLVPKDPENHRDLFRRDQSDLDGTFSLYGVVPGSYYLVAIENGWDLDWSQPTVIAAYAKHGRSIEVHELGKPMSLTEAVALQLR
jgi:protocatechuate 3,4-dioxygenase beta subunit